LCYLLVKIQNETGARPGRKVKIINLGLDPEEAVAMGLEIEKVEKSGRKKRRGELC